VVAAVIATGLVVAAMTLPWLTLLPVHGAAAVLAHALSLVAAFHGAGLVVAWLAGPRAHSPWLILQWGVAALIGLSGLAIVVGAGTLTVQTIAVFGFAAVHTVSLGVRLDRHARRIRAGLTGPWIWLVPAALLAGLGALVVLGAAGDALARPFDDETHLLAQLRRVLDTGTLADPIGYRRSAQLGGQIALAALASGAGDGVAAILEPLGLVLALGFAIGQLRVRDRGAALWAGVLVIAAFALAPADPLPCWTAVGLGVALYVMLGESEPPQALPVALTAGALIALRYELAPIAAVAVITTWWRQRNDHHRTAVLIGGVFAVGFPFLVTRMLAWRSVPLIARAAVDTPPQAALALRLALAALIAIPATCLLRLVLPASRAVRVAGLATAVALAALAAHVTSAGPYALRLAWPIAIAFAIVVVIELARSHALGAAALIGSLLLCAVIYAGGEAPGRLQWSDRLAAAATAIESLERPPADHAAPYAALLASVPPGATIAIWVAAPEQLDYARHRILDLRTPAGAQLRRFRWGAHTSRLESLLTAVSASYLLVEADDAHLQRARSLRYRAICQPQLPTCADDLQAVALRHRVVAQRDNLQLIELRP
jgi:hypothetical protein